MDENKLMGRTIFDYLMKSRNEQTVETMSKKKKIISYMDLISKI